MNPAPKLRPALEQRLSLPQYDSLWKSVTTAFANEYWEDERDYWDYALGLRDSWAAMSRAPAKQVEKTVSEIAALARCLAIKIHTYAPELKTLKGYLDIDLHSFMAEDLVRFADGLDEPNSPTAAMRSRPRSMALPTAERTYIARALTHFILSGVNAAGKPIRGRDSLVAMTVCALLDIGKNDEFDGKDVGDVTKDIVAHYKRRPEPSCRPKSAIMRVNLPS
ncbi:hypothetical protein [Rhodoferax sp. PAMC 29310]|uniref:hypothetical protein n=1 Tax=Rhodoferax sp. PAMC 29310 TaxID=2822760 RepID=UPI001B32329E|nr:hypothetical protein [Rhodoferax sp. PAMC 29310]